MISEATESNEPLQFTPRELNIIASMMLSNLTDDGEITFAEGYKFKMFFNTILDNAVNRADEMREVIAELDEWEKEHAEELKDFDPVKAAEELSAEVGKGYLS